MCEVEEYIKNPEQYRFCEEYRLPTMIAYLRECDRKIFCPNCGGCMCYALFIFKCRRCGFEKK